MTVAYRVGKLKRDLRDSLASSDSRKRPGMMYVRERRADSVCETEDALSETKASYLRSRALGAIASDVVPGAERKSGLEALAEAETWPESDVEVEVEALVTVWR